jgi:ParB family chromosome partitioning protein
VQPVTVRKVGDEYELIVGERRWRASTNIGLDQMPAYVLDVDSDVEIMELALIENVQRRDLNPMELAHAYNALVEQHGLSQEEVAKQVGKSRSAITNIIRLLNLPSYIQNSLRNGDISAGHARALLSIEDESLQEKVWEKVVEEGLSVRNVEKIVQEAAEPPEKSSSTGTTSSGKPEKSPYVREVEERLQHNLGTKVNIRTKKNGGAIEIQYYSNEDLDRLLNLFDDIEY